MLLVDTGIFVSVADRTQQGVNRSPGVAPAARVLQQADGRFSVVVDGERGLITTFQNLSQSSLDKLAKNYGWTTP